jgi:hypothetical protein
MARLASEGTHLLVEDTLVTQQPLVAVETEEADYLVEEVRGQQLKQLVHQLEELVVAVSLAEVVEQEMPQLVEQLLAVQADLVLEGLEEQVLELDLEQILVVAEGLDTLPLDQMAVVLVVAMEDSAAAAAVAEMLEEMAETVPYFYIIRRNYE